MKMIMKRLCVVASALALVLGLSQCMKDKAMRWNENGEVAVTLTASKGSLTKTSLEQNADNDLVVKWTTGDKLYAVGETDGLLGSLTLTDGDGEATGEFGGNIKYVSAKQTVRFYYVGKNKSISGTGDTYTLNLDKQDGTLASIVDTLHLMSGSLSNVTPKMVNLGTVTMGNVISIVNVDTKTAFGEVSGIKLSGSVNNGVLNLKTGTVTPTSGDITLTATASNDCYIALLANGAMQTFQFSYEDQSRNIDAKQIIAGKYYTDNGNSVQLNEKFEFVDLGLSVLWANMNLGAGKVTGYGDYYAWGELEPYHADGYSAEDPVAHWRSMTTGAGNTDITGYNWHTYSKGGTTTFTEWTIKPYDETTRNLLPEFDAANYVIPGSHIPTLEEWKELKSNCNCVWTEDYNGTGIHGYILTSKVSGYTDKSIFLPAAGNISGTEHTENTGTRSSYMSSTRWVNEKPYNIYATYIYTGYFQPEYGGTRYVGFPIRAVKEKAQEPIEFIDLDLPSGTLWANMNVGAKSPSDYGKYYAWGELNPYYSSMYFDYTKESASFVWKTGKTSGYANQSYYGSSAYTEWNPVPYDSSNKLKAEYDVCTQQFDSESRMPTLAEWQELADNCTWTKLYNTYKVISKSDDSKFIILPMAGKIQTTIYYPFDNDKTTKEGRYWSSDFTGSTFSKGYYIKANDTKGTIPNAYRNFGFTVRAVKEKPVTPMEYVDLGLSVLWASRNLGAANEENAGDYYAWGETSTKKTYKWSNYKYGSSSTTMTKYCTNSGMGTVDNKVTLVPEDDAATQLYSDAYTPTMYEWQELFDENKCSFEFLTNGSSSTLLSGYTAKADGLLVVSKVPSFEGNHIFLPAANMKADESGDATAISDLTTRKGGCYMSSTVCHYDPNQPYNQRFASIKVAESVNDPDAYSGGQRYRGFSVRAVKQKTDGYIENGWNYGPGITVDGVTWAPVNCGIGNKYENPMGKLYQWGRKVGTGYNTGTAPFKVETAQTKVVATDNFDSNGYNKTPADDKFYWIGAMTSPYDWYANATSKQMASWPISNPDGTTGIGNPCPTGWRVPTKDELGSLVYSDWNAGTHTGSAIRGSFNSTTQKWEFGTVSFPAAGYRDYSNGNFGDRGTVCRYWSSTDYGSNGHAVAWRSDISTGLYGSARADGFSVRCVKE